MEKMKNKHEIYCVNEDAVERYDLDAIRRIMDFFGGLSSAIACSHKDIGFLSIVGSLGRGFWDYYSSDYISIQEGLSSLIADEAVNQIVLFIDSPGGMASGLFSLCSYIKTASEIKPIHAFINGMACSAAYAIATACSDITIEPDSETGCCGAIGHVFKIDEEFEKSHYGFIEKIFRSKNAPRKCMSPLDDEKAELEYQQSIDECGDQYLAFVAAERGVDLNTAKISFGEGRVVTASYALAHGMVDKVATWADYSTGLVGSVEDVSIANNSDSSLSVKEESEGAEMDIEKMSAEERQTAFDSLIQANPELLSSIKEKAAKDERERVTALNAMKNGVAGYDAIIDSAIAEGKGENETKIALFDYLSLNPAVAKDEAEPKTGAVLDALAGSDQSITPIQNGLSEFEQVMRKVEEERK